MSQTAVIVGSGGQDGTLLQDFLAQRGYDLVLISRAGVRHGDTTAPFDIRDAAAVEALVRQTSPAEIYYLAAHHHSSQDDTGDDGALFRASYETNVDGLVNVLEAIRKSAAGSRLFYAASSHVFGRPDSSQQNEQTAMRPVSPYGITKAAGLSVCRYYRETRNVFAAVGILYNHESPLRQPQFISRKLARAAAMAKAGRISSVTVGNLEATADWGWAPDFVEAMWQTLALDDPEMFVVATGVSHTVREMADAAFSEAQLDYNDFVQVNGALLQRSTARLQGDSTKLRSTTGWAPSLGFREMMAEMVKAEMGGLQ